MDFQNGLLGGEAHYEMSLIVRSHRLREKEPALCSSHTVPVEQGSIPFCRSCRVHGAPQVLVVLPWVEEQPKALLLTACFCFAVLPWPLIKFQFEVLRHKQCSNTSKKIQTQLCQKTDASCFREKQLSVPLFRCFSLTNGLILMFSLCLKTALVAGT